MTLSSCISSVKGDSMTLSCVVGVSIACVEVD